MNIIRMFLIVLLLTQLQGCSRIKIAYSQLNWLLPYYLETYVELSDDQSSYLEDQVKMILVWHCAMQLPDYAELLRKANTDFQTGKMSHKRLNYFAEQFEQFWFDLMQKISPVIAQLLLTANDEQLEELYKSLKDKNREWLAEFQEKSDEELQDEYRESMYDELERWFGPLQEAQQLAINKWVNQFRPLGMEGLEMRRKWQSRLRELTTHRTNIAAFKLGIEKLLLKPELLHSSSYQKLLDDNRKTTIDLLYSIGKQIDKSQREHLAGEALAIAQDFDDLTCRGDYTTTPARAKIATYQY